MDIAIRQFSENIILKILAYSARFDDIYLERLRDRQLEFYSKFIEM